MDGFDLALLPPLNIIKHYSHEELIIAAAQAAGVEDQTPANPLYRNILANSYRELLVRTDANEQALGLVLASAKGPQLDHIAVTYYKHPDGSPVQRLSGEKDDVFRDRVQRSPEGLSVAGPIGSYQYHASNADAGIKQVWCESLSALVMDVYVLEYALPGAVTPAVKLAVEQYLEPRRPFGDDVQVKSAQMLDYHIDAMLSVKAGPDSQIIQAAALAAVQAFVELKRTFGAWVSDSSVKAVLTLEGVESVALTGFQEQVASGLQVPVCSSISVGVQEI